MNTWKLEAAGMSKFFYTAKDENGDETKRMGVLRKAVVVVSLVNRNGTTEKVAFAKTNRGQNYRDSRGKRTEKKNEWGDKIVGIAPLMIGYNDCKAELCRMLGEAEGLRALDALSF